MSFLKPDPPPAIPAPKQPESPPPVLSPMGSRPNSKSQRTSFLGAGAVPSPAPSESGGTRGKTLLGQ